jgi:hypothetical protein
MSKCEPREMRLFPRLIRTWNVTRPEYREAYRVYAAEPSGFSVLLQWLIWKRTLGHYSEDDIVRLVLEEQTSGKKLMYVLMSDTKISYDETRGVLEGGHEMSPCCTP